MATTYTMVHRCLLGLALFAGVHVAAAQQPAPAAPSFARGLVGGLGGAGVGVLSWPIFIGMMSNDSCDEVTHRRESEWCEAEPTVLVVLAILPPVLAASGALWTSGRLNDRHLDRYAFGGAAVGAFPGLLVGGIIGGGDAGAVLLGAAVGMGVGAAVGIQAGWQNRLQVAPRIGRQNGLSLLLRL